MTSFNAVLTDTSHDKFPSSLKSMALDLCDDDFLKSKQSFDCQVCGRSFTRKDKLKNHCRIHTGDIFTCPVCQRTCLTKDALQRHMRIHTGEKPFKCTRCDYSASRKDHLRYHCMALHAVMLSN